MRAYNNNRFIFLKVNSKVLSSERKLVFGDGTTLYYGTKNENMCGTITITVKARFKPLTRKKDYLRDIRSCRLKFMGDGGRMLRACRWVNAYHILTTDFTERGIAYGKPCKLKYQIYLTPTERNTLDHFSGDITTLCSDMNALLRECLDDFGFVLKNDSSGDL